MTGRADGKLIRHIPRKVIRGVLVMAHHPELLLDAREDRRKFLAGEDRHSPFGPGRKWSQTDYDCVIRAKRFFEHIAEHWLPDLRDEFLADGDGEQDG